MILSSEISTSVLDSGVAKGQAGGKEGRMLPTDLETSWYLYKLSRHHWMR